MSKSKSNKTKDECLKILKDGSNAAKKAGFKVLSVKIK